MRGLDKAHHHSHLSLVAVTLIAPGATLTSMQYLSIVDNRQVSCGAKAMTFRVGQEVKFVERIQVGGATYIVSGTGIIADRPTRDGFVAIDAHPIKAWRYYSPSGPTRIEALQANVRETDRLSALLLKQDRLRDRLRIGIPSEGDS